MFGFLVVDKPQGMTSRAVLDWAMTSCRSVKAGHAGTLDPLANGVLVVCLGPATRLVPFVQLLPKTYRASFRLGWESDTEDVLGEVQQIDKAPFVTAADIESLLPQFLGTIEQLPPRFSALRVQGQRAYELARLGVSFDLQPRPVTIYKLKLIDYNYPNFTIEMTCGSGTYVRSLGRDLGQRLNSAAIMTQLVRTAIGGFTLQNAMVFPHNRQPPTAAEIETQIIPPAQGLLEAGDWQAITLNQAQLIDLSFGRKLNNPPQFAADSSAIPPQWLAIDDQKHLIAIMKDAGGGVHRSIHNFSNWWKQP